ncbi:MAG: AMP-binding protein [Flavobacteriaceae bacterium]|nr:AMP-binding protein [Flavobacteriaceae bacterium]
MKVTPENIHNRFQLNGFHFDRDGLQQVAYSFVKEGDHYEQEAGRFLMDWLDDKPYIEVMTSGSTGKPKPIQIPKQQMVDSALATGDFFGVTVGHSGLMCLPASYIAGKMMFVRAFILGLNVELVTPSSHPLDPNSDTTYDFGAMVPLQALNSFDQLHRIGTLLVGGGRLSDAAREKLKTAPCEIYETFGMTETVTHFAARNIKTEPFFKTMEGVKVQADAEGKLIVKMPWMEEAVHTTDVVRIISDSSFDWLGRADYVINSGGVKLHPEQIEPKLESHITERFFVTGIPCDVLGEKTVLVIEGTERNLPEEVFADLTDFEKPKHIYFVPEFQTSSSGKVRRAATLDTLKL